MVMMMEHKPDENEIIDVDPASEYENTGDTDDRNSNSMSRS